MEVKEFLLKEDAIVLAVIAHRMWPKNKRANAYLSAKLHGGRPFTMKDALLAQKVLRELGHTLTELTVADKY